MQTHLWWMSGVDICKIVSKFLQALEPRHPDSDPWYHTPESGRLHKAENTDNLFDYQCFLVEKFVLQVELGGVEPPSKQVTDVLSTCLSRGWFSKPAWTRAPKQTLIPYEFTGSAGRCAGYPVFTSASWSPADGRGWWETSCPHNCCRD